MTPVFFPLFSTYSFSISDSFIFSSFNFFIVSSLFLEGFWFYYIILIASLFSANVIWWLLIILSLSWTKSSANSIPTLIFPSYLAHIFLSSANSPLFIFLSEYWIDFFLFFSHSFFHKNTWYLLIISSESNSLTTFAYPMFQNGGARISPWKRPKSKFYFLL